MAKSQRNVIQITLVYFIFRNREQTLMRPIAHAQFCLPWIDHRYNSRYGHGGGTILGPWVEPWRTSMVDGYGLSTGSTGCAKNPGLCTLKRAIFHNFGAERKQKYGKKVYLLDNKDG